MKTMGLMLGCWVLALMGCVKATPTGEAWASIERGALLIDVRTAGEFSSGHLEGALNIPYQETAALETAIGPDKGRAVSLYCRSGRRSGLAAAALADRGYTNVVNIGGYAELRAARP